MHKRLEAELVSLAHSILQMKNKDDVKALHKKAQDIYEKLSVLKFVDEYFLTTPNFSETKEEIVDEIKEVFDADVEDEIVEVIEKQKKIDQKEILTEEQDEEIFSLENTLVKDDSKDIPLHSNSLEDELKEAISADEATQLFERVTKNNPTIEEAPEKTQRSLNDTLFKNNLQVGLNDRIAFVNHLFGGNMEDFNRVLSQLNSFKTEKDAKNFINKMVKPDYNWNESEEYEQRLNNLIERKFL